MNLYIVVEGRIVEKAVYKEWIPHINPMLSYVEYLSDVVNNNFVIRSGNGYPGYFDLIENGLRDVAADQKYSRLIICIDSEDMTRQDKYNEVDAFVKRTRIVGVDYRIVVQHFCFETWALGHRKIGRNPKDARLIGYRRLYNVTADDPEGLPNLPTERLNRSQFAEKYLRLMLNDKNKQMTYSKRNPSYVAHPKFMKNVRSRFEDTGHIGSFGAFLTAVSP